MGRLVRERCSDHWRCKMIGVCSILRILVTASSLLQPQCFCVESSDGLIVVGRESDGLRLTGRSSVNPEMIYSPYLCSCCRHSGDCPPWNTYHALWWGHKLAGIGRPSVFGMLVLLAAFCVTSAVCCQVVNFWGLARLRCEYKKRGVRNGPVEQEYGCSLPFPETSPHLGR